MIKNIRGKVAGFTLIELVMVIVILGVPGAVALPKFVDLSDEAQVAKVKSIAGAISAASVANLAAVKTGNPSGVEVRGTDVCSLGYVTPFFGDGLPEGYEIVLPDDSNGVQDGDNVSCTGEQDAAYCTVASTENGLHRARVTILCAVNPGGGSYCDTHPC